MADVGEPANAPVVPRGEPVGPPAEAVRPPGEAVRPPGEAVRPPGEVAQPPMGRERRSRSRSRQRQRVLASTRTAGGICTGTAMLARLVEATDLMCERVRRECAVSLRPREQNTNFVERVDECEQAVRVLADHVKAVGQCADAITGSF